MKNRIRFILERELARYSEFRESRFLEGIPYLAFFVESLLSWNKKMNLVGRKEVSLLFHDILVDSLFMVKFLEDILEDRDVLLDIGSGAGIPGIPFRIYFRSGRYVMLEPRKKRYVFINLMLRKLSLENTEVLPLSLENIKSDVIPSLVLARGVWGWKDLLKKVAPLLSPRGLVLIFSHSEPSHSKWKQFSLLSHYRYHLYHGRVRYFWLFEKNAPS